MQSGPEKRHGCGLVVSKMPAFSGPQPTAKAPGDDDGNGLKNMYYCSGDTWPIRAYSVLYVSFSVFFFVSDK